MEIFKLVTRGPVIPGSSKQSKKAYDVEVASIRQVEHTIPRDEQETIIIDDFYEIRIYTCNTSKMTYYLKNKSKPKYKDYIIENIDVKDGKPVAITLVFKK